jgi:hypothetical protein
VQLCLVRSTFFFLLYFVTTVHKFGIGILITISIIVEDFVQYQNKWRKCVARTKQVRLSLQGHQYYPIRRRDLDRPNRD